MPEKKLNNTSDQGEFPFPSLDEANFFILSNIIKSMPGYIYWKDREGRFLGCNDVLLEDTGMKSILGKTDFDMPWSEFAPEIRATDLKVMELNTSLELEETIITTDEQLVVVLTRKTPLRDENGRVLGIIGTSLNINNRKKHESELYSTQEKTQLTLENIVANMPGFVYWKDKNGIYLGCNNRHARSLGFRYGYEIVGKTDFDYLGVKTMLHCSVKMIATL